MAFSDSAWAVNEILEKTGDPSSPAGTDTLFGYNKRGLVKSVQRLKVNGTVVGSTGNQEEYPCDDTTWHAWRKSVKISAVNPSKTIVLCYNPVLDYTDAPGRNGGAKLKDSTTVYVFGTGYTETSGKYSSDFVAEIQVIEFY